eukprot:COSAG01_NODE_37409_length_504_cov_0.523457_1_plen_41_part_10
MELELAGGRAHQPRRGVRVISSLLPHHHIIIIIIIIIITIT